ncbi:Threonylcarbamoyladenosine tRNA methylthiotransferase MtaB [Candidatus Cyrtobacter comes]|uniref:Threonylcarbamoyladenosine tRNA methylthiotransferase MtaB n=1 Tax=Candidatus Cyrtobacter comes TaxID=675776 RepID=A0ABU5L687_9RICK|nr:tRNA (N(6)-L-threonylcarbamoyladenosine(37)-C(2))-methylthiotransferase MtaB [Candidatus Cyrtobacter comes]MDZ5761648.1 Threonylcarbamoyladenosine tRNA methylthiotransferase MtaB [Candidatus Cyrtobacter comes]
MEIITFGCRLNNYESDEINKLLDTKGYTGAVIINSCAVTKEAERQLSQTLRKIRREDPQKKIILTGCASTINGKKYEEMADFIIDNSQKLHITSYEKILEKEDSTIQMLNKAPSKIVALPRRSRAYIQIQNGCNHSCTFCIIPQGRGASKSIPVGEVYEKVRTAVENGCNEVVFTGVDITDYGIDLPGKPTITQLLERILRLLPNLHRLRLSSIDVAELDDDFIDLFSREKRLTPYLHLSMQAGDDMVLKRMKRRHSRNDIITFCKKARAARPDVVFGADIISGFPTETDQMFTNTFTLIKDLRIAHLHVFPYSERDGTPAAKMPQVDKRIRKERAAILRTLGSDILHEHYKSQVGRLIDVIVEGGRTGKAADFSTVKLEGDDVEVGKLIKVRVIRALRSSIICDTGINSLHDL